MVIAIAVLALTSDMLVASPVACRMAIDSWQF